MLHYGFELNKEQTWHIVDVTDKAGWLRDFARSAGIKCSRPQRPSATIIIDSLEDTDTAQRRLTALCAHLELPATGWKFRDTKKVIIGIAQGAYLIAVKSAASPSRRQTFHQHISSLLYPVYKTAIKAGGLPLHAALIEREKEGYLIIGRSGAGKSTCCRRIPQPWRALSDEEVLVLPREDGGYFCHPFPNLIDLTVRNIKRRCCIEKKLPLKAVFILEQAPADSASVAGRAFAVARITESAQGVSVRYKAEIGDGKVTQHRRREFENGCRLAGSVPVFRLLATLEGRFWDEMAESSAACAESR